MIDNIAFQVIEIFLLLDEIFYFCIQSQVIQIDLLDWYEIYRERKRDIIEVVFSQFTSEIEGKVEVIISDTRQFKCRIEREEEILLSYFENNGK